MSTSFMNISDAPTLTNKLGSILRSTSSIRLPIGRRKKSLTPVQANRRKTRPAPLILAPSYGSHRVRLPVLASPEIFSAASEFTPLTPFITTVDARIDPQSLRSPSLWLNQTGLVEPCQISVYSESNDSLLAENQPQQISSRKQKLRAFLWKNNATNTSKPKRSAHERALSFQRRHLHGSPPRSPVRFTPSPLNFSSTRRPSLVESLMQPRRGSILVSSHVYTPHTAESIYSCSSSSSSSTFSFDLESNIFRAGSETPTEHADASSMSNASTFSLPSARSPVYGQSRHTVMNDYAADAASISSASTASLPIPIYGRDRHVITSEYTIIAVEDSDSESEDDYGIAY